MRAEESLRQGNLEDSLRHLQAEVQKKPADPKLRVFLFQLLCVLGDWQRALKQLDVLSNLDTETMPMVQTYTSALQAEAVRAEVFAGKRAPLVLGEPEQWIALQLHALKLGAEGQAKEATKLREEAFEAAPATAGNVDGEAFEWIADCDVRVGPMLEAVMNGRYQWIPFHRLKRIEIEAPVDLRDLVWAPAHLTISTGAQVVALIPARYPGSERQEDNELRMSRKTHWVADAAGMDVGLGQRVMATSEAEYPLLARREITLQTTLTDG
ncbi:MAG: virulence protein SciE type [Proteobacteria bacterium]|nr:MAG: virulence protein SciE type [Pseudomonadota bacterium]